MEILSEEFTCADHAWTQWL